MAVRRLVTVGLVIALMLAATGAAARTSEPGILAGPTTLGSGYRWHTFYGSNSDDYAYGMAVDASGNIYVTGDSRFWLGDSGASPLHPFTSGGTTINTDLFVLKLNSSGAYQWHTFYGSTDTDYGYDIVVDDSGNVYVTGYSHISWQGDGGADPLHPLSTNGNIFVLKLNGSGAYQWHTFYGSSSDDLAYGIAVDGEGNVCVAGKSPSSWLGDGDIAPLHPHSGSLDLVVLKLDSSGTYQWHTFYGSDAHASGIAVDGSANLYVVGASYYPWLGDGGAAPLHPFAGSGHWDLFVLKLTGGGAYQWHTFYGSTVENFEDGRGIALDEDGDVYVAGVTMSWQGPGGQAPLHPFTGTCDTVVLKLDSGGAYQWHTFYGPDSFYLNDRGHRIAVDGSGNLYVTKVAGNTLLKLTGSGVYRWQVDYQDFSSSDVAPDQGSGVYVAGTGGTFQGPNGEAPLHPGTSLYDIAVLALTRLDSVYVDPAGACGGQIPCFTTVGDGLGALGPGDTLYIYPGTYHESLDLGSTILPGDLHIVTVDPNGVPTPHTATILPAAGPALYTTARLPGSISLNGLTVLSAEDGVRLAVEGDISVTNVIASNNGEDGLDLDAGGSVAVLDTTASDNGGNGLRLTAGASSQRGVTAAGDVTVQRVTAGGNDQAGIQVLAAGGAVSVLDSWIAGNTSQGIALGAVGGAATVGGSILCRNATGLELSTAITAAAEGNWWGCTGGPGAEGCDPITPGPATVDAEPWIADVDGSAVFDPVTVGQAAAIRFQISGGGGTVFLGQGPGDMNGVPPFVLDTDNGTIIASTSTGSTVSEFINQPDGTLEASLVASQAGSATVTLTGSCGLQGATTVGAIYRVHLPLVLRGWPGP